MGESPNRLVFAIGICVAALLVGGVIGNSSRSSIDPPAAVRGVPTTSVASTMKVHVAGSVVNPGVVTVPDGSIVADAVSAAGGFLATADPTRVNLAAPVTQGQQIVIPGQGGDGSGVGDSGATGDGLLSLNQASESELQELPGVGPVLAGRIVAHREANGPFQAVEDLLQVPGIGEAKLASIRDLVRP